MRERLLVSWSGGKDSALALHALAGTGTATVTLNEDERLSVDQVVRLLEFAWQQTDVLRLRFRPRPPEEQQPSLLG